jgi:glycerol-3-phosphate O-acyltransferase / dihydroxyacetone phosphate acyltransferase
VIYALMRAVAGLALRWFYSSIDVSGVERIPKRRPLLLVVNHPNALVDALIVAWIVPRRVLITAKATIFQNPLANALLRWVGVVPLRRASDEPVPNGLDAARNRATFRAVQDALRRGGTVLIFPEGRSTDAPSLGPLKTGAARMALSARESGAVAGLAVVPIGLTFERKQSPRTRVFAQIGEPIVMDDWQAPVGVGMPDSDALTNEIETRLRALTLNYTTIDDAARAVRLASSIAAVLDGPPTIGSGERRLGVEAGIAKRIDVLASRLPEATPAVRDRAERLVDRLDALQREIANRGLRIEDVNIRVDGTAGARFVFRETWILLLGGPIALWGAINHWLPFRAAEAVAVRPGGDNADPAMRAVVGGAVFVLITYALQTVLVDRLWGWRVALVYLASLPIAADINFWLRERMGRARRRAKAFMVFRRDPAMRSRLVNELASLRDDVTTLDRELGEIERATNAIRGPGE